MDAPASFVLSDGSVEHQFLGGAIRLIYRDIRKGGPGYEATCSVYFDRTAIDHVRINLLDQRNRYFIVQSLSRHTAHIPDWDWHRAFVLSTEAMRDYFAGGEDLIDLRAVQPEPISLPLIDPIIEDTIVLWAGHGGIFKSLFSLLAVHQLATGKEILGRGDGKIRNCLVLDYEEPTPSAAARRVRLIEQRHPMGPDGEMGRVWYRNEGMPIITTAPTLARLVDEYDIGFVVIDSLGVARGGAAESSHETIAAMDAIRSLGRPCLVLDHLKQDDGHGSGQDRPFGSVYTRNLTRALWTLRRPEGQTNQVEFTHRKANHSPMVNEPQLYEIEWESGYGINAYPLQWRGERPIDLSEHFSASVS